MSDPVQTQKPRRHPLLTAAMILIGVVLLLPGLCSAGILIWAVGDEGLRAFNDASMVSLWLVTFLIATAGVFLIAFAVRR